MEIASRAFADLKDLENILTGNDIAKNGKRTMENGRLRINDLNSIPGSNKRGWLSFDKRRNYSLEHLARMNFRRRNSPRSYGGGQDRYF